MGVQHVPHSVLELFLDLREIPSFCKRHAARVSYPEVEPEVLGN